MDGKLLEGNYGCPNHSHHFKNTIGPLSLENRPVGGGGGQVRMGEGRRVRAEAAGHLQLGLQL